MQFIYVNGSEILVEDLESKNDSWFKWNLSAFSEDSRLYCYVDDKVEVKDWIEHIIKAKELYN